MTNCFRPLVAVAVILGAAAVAILEATPQAVSTAVHPLSGRVFAQVMSFEGAPWLDREDRDIEEAPDRAIDALDIRAGQVVADVGAGSGYMSVRLAKRVGVSGRVYATDIQPQMVALLEQRLRTDRIFNISPVLGSIDDPKLPEDALDLVLLVDVYHEFSEPQKMLRGMRRALKPNGRLVLLEYRKEDPRVPIRADHKMSIAEARMEVEAEGFILSRVDNRLPRQHILIFTRRE